jgi:riboflavin kinase/FMN adenylyltransferase
MRVFRDLISLPVFKNTIVTIGSFDGVHEGHLHILTQVREYANAMKSESIVITFDPHPRTVLQPDDTTFKLITTTEEKIKLIAAQGIDNVIVIPFSLEFSQQSAQDYVEDFLIKNFNPAYIVIGYDHHFGKNRSGNLDFLKKYEESGHFKIHEIPAQTINDLAISSSKIRNALDNSDILQANRLLGHPFSFSGRVVYGKQIGRTIGFPTANILIEDRFKLVLKSGIYAVYALINDKKYKGMLYIGSRPTIEANGLQTIEVNILDFDEDIYGEFISIEVIDFIRGDKKLDGLDALKNQISEDKIAILACLGKSEESDSVKSEAMTQSDSVNKVPKIAVVILNYNTQNHLETYLPSVINHSGEAEIIVADNGSPDDSIAFLQKNYPKVQVLDLKKNYGFAQGYNEALKQIKADYYVILNSDVEVTAGWIKPIIAAMQQNPSIAIAQPKILSWRDKSKFEYAGAAGGWIDFLGYPFCRGRIFQESEADEGQYDTPQACFWAAGAAFFIKADLYHTFGGFDGDYFAHNEEIDLCWRIKRAGYEVWCFPESKVYHLGGGTLEYENPRKVFLNFRNSLYTILKNETFINLLWLIPARFLLDGLAGLMFAFKGQWGSILGILKAHFSFYSTFRRTWKKRQETVHIVDNQQIKPNFNNAGVYMGSVVKRYYLHGLRKYSQLKINKNRP